MAVRPTRQALPAAVLVTVVALLALPVPAMAGTLSSSPPSSSYNAQPWYFGSQFNNFQITNSGTPDTILGPAVITGPDAANFSIGDNCNGLTLPDGGGCNVGVNFNPPNGPGTFSVQLEIPSDGSPNPLVVPLSAQALAGPFFAASPPRVDFGATPVGAARTQVVTITNIGDFPGAPQQAFIVGPAEFEIEDDQCSQQPVNPGQGCTLTALFAPSSAASFQGSIFVIAGSPTQAVLPINLSGMGEAGLGPPNTRITRRPRGRIRSTTAGFQFSSPNAGVTFECKLDRERYAPCTSPSTYVVKRGRHRFRVRAKDAAGNLDATPASASWVAIKKPAQLEENR